MSKKIEHSKEKTNLHPRNKHRERYNFEELIQFCPELAQFVELNDYQDLSIDFFDPKAVKMLNKALLKCFYGIKNWDIPENYLCPPIPSRADYIHYIADVLGSKFENKIPTGEQIKCLDIGVGANCVYPLIGNSEYGWSFVATDIDVIALESANKIIESNPFLEDKIELVLQNNPKNIFYGIIQKDELIDLTICNPPFHSSVAQAQAESLRKLNHLKQQKNAKIVLNFGGKSSELCYQGGEQKFVRDMVWESKQFWANCFWFSSLISKESSLKNIYEALEKAGAREVKTIQMAQGNKVSRLVVWTFLSERQQEKWINLRWK